MVRSAQLWCDYEFKGLWLAALMRSASEVMKFPKISQAFGYGAAIKDQKWTQIQFKNYYVLVYYNGLYLFISMYDKIHYKLKKIKIKTKKKLLCIFSHSIYEKLYLRQ